MSPKKIVVLLLLLASSVTVSSSAKKHTSAHREEVESTDKVAAVLWHEPADIASRSLYYGPGGVQHEPHGRFTFVKEDLDGSNPKFTVVDGDGTKWKVKLGAEARPETVASRLVWAVGFSSDEDYFVPDLQVDGIAAPLHRGGKLMAPDGSFANVRLKLESKKTNKLGNWQWRHNPFSGTRELNGLRVLMAVINNWDLKDSNNAVYLEKHGDDAMPEQIYLVSDLGASFGANGLEKDRDNEKGNLDWYRRSRFVTSMTPEFVNFATPRRATILALGNPHEFFSRLGLRWIGRDIPRSDASWMGQLLARLSHEQVRDAFRAAGYSSTEVEGFSQILEQRITALNRLSEDENESFLHP
jgi:hypothetical protein